MPDLNNTRRYQIFVSSTFEDLQDEREQLLQIITEIGHMPVGMEYFNLENAEIFKAIQKLIEDCDYYVLILGGRYGHVLPSDYRIADYRGLSYTEAEYNYARELGMPIQAYVLSNDACKRPSPEEDPVKSDKLKKFKDRVKIDGHHIWSDTTDLARKFATKFDPFLSENPREGWVRGRFMHEMQLFRYFFDSHNEDFDDLGITEDFLPGLPKKIKTMEAVVHSIELLLKHHVGKRIPHEMRAYFAYRLSKPSTNDDGVPVLYRLGLSTCEDQPEWLCGTLAEKGSNVGKVFESGDRMYIADTDCVGVCNQKVAGESSVLGVPVKVFDHGHNPTVVGVLGISSDRKEGTYPMLKFAEEVSILLSWFFKRYLEASRDHDGRIAPMDRLINELAQFLDDSLEKRSD